MQFTLMATMWPGTHNLQHSHLWWYQKVSAPPLASLTKGTPLKRKSLALLDPVQQGAQFCIFASVILIDCWCRSHHTRTKLLLCSRGIPPPIFFLQVYSPTVREVRTLLILEFFPNLSQILFPVSLPRLFTVDLSLEPVGVATRAMTHPAPL